MLKSALKNNKKYKILTDDGWSDFDGMRTKEVTKTIFIVTEKNNKIECTPEHLICTANNEFKEAINLKKGDSIKTIEGFDKVENVLIENKNKKHVYDILEVEKGNKYFTNNILSHNCSFMGSTSTLLNSQTLKNLSFAYPIVEKEGISQYEKPQHNHQYVATADVSQGKGLDYSTISVFDITTMPYKQVCTFRDNLISAMDFAPLIYRICNLYNNAQLLVEVNDNGSMVAETLLMDLGYEELLFTENSGRHGKRISGGFSASKVDKGLRTTKTTKAKGCSILKMLIEQEQLIIRDYHTISELSRFVKRGASYQAEVGYHDDLVMTLVNFAWLTEQQYFKELTDIDTAQALREKTDQQWEDELLPLGFNNSGGDADMHRMKHPNEEIVEWYK